MNTPIKPAEMKSGRVTTEGDSIYYQVRGHGQPLIMIAGAGGEADEFHLVADLLLDEYKVITYDRRAKARSTLNAPDHFEIAQQSRDVVAVIRAIGEESAFVFGNSSGAVIALDVATTQPQVVRAVIAHEPPITPIHPDAQKWQCFYSSVYNSAFSLGASLAAMRFFLGTGFPVRKLIKATGDVHATAPKTGEPRLPKRAVTEFLIKQELLPVINYQPDVEAVKQNGVKVFMAAGQMSLDKKWWYAQTASIMAEKLGCEFVIFPGHHGSFMDMPHEWSAVLRDVLHKAVSNL